MTGEISNEAGTAGRKVWVAVISCDMVRLQAAPQLLVPSWLARLPWQRHALRCSGRRP